MSKRNKLATPDWMRVKMLLLQINQAQMAKVIGVSQARLSLFMNGKKFFAPIEDRAIRKAIREEEERAGTIDIQQWFNCNLARLGISGYHLMIMCGLDTSLSYKWASGKANPRYSSVIKIMAAFDRLEKSQHVSGLLPPNYGKATHCKHCKYRQECLARITSNMPMMCEPVSPWELVKAYENGHPVESLIWWLGEEEARRAVERKVDEWRAHPDDLSHAFLRT